MLASTHVQGLPSAQLPVLLVAFALAMVQLFHALLGPFPMAVPQLAAHLAQKAFSVI